MKAMFSSQCKCRIYHNLAFQRVSYSELKPDLRAILSDVTPPAERSKALAGVGIAFAVCFCIGPPIGAYFASRPLPETLNVGIELNIYAVPAMLTLVLLLAETAFLYVFLPETRSQKHRSAKRSEPSASSAKRHPKTQPASVRIGILRTLGQLHFLFLVLFSGAEFTLTFLTFDRKPSISF